MKNEEIMTRKMVAFLNVFIKIGKHDQRTVVVIGRKV